MPNKFGIIGIPKRGFGPLTKPPPNAKIDPNHWASRGLVGCYRLYGNGRDDCGLRDGTLTGTTSFGITPSGNCGIVLGGSGHVSVPLGAFVSVSELSLTWLCSMNNTSLEYRTEYNSGVYISIRLNEGSAGNINVLVYDGVDPTSKGIGSGAAGSLIRISATAKSGSFARGYLNGSEGFSDTTFGNFRDVGTTAFNIAANRGGTSNRLVGTTDLVLCHSRALNPTEIAQLHYSPYQFFWVPGRRTFFLPLSVSARNVTSFNLNDKRKNMYRSMLFGL